MRRDHQCSTVAVSREEYRSANAWYLLAIIAPFPWFDSLQKISNESVGSHRIIDHLLVVPVHPGRDHHRHILYHLANQISFR